LAGKKKRSSRAEGWPSLGKTKYPKRMIFKNLENLDYGQIEQNLDFD
jgi:hypothetical protein